MEKEKEFCDNCGKNITNMVKYSHKDIKGWYCEHCYFGPYTNSTKPLKIVYEKTV